MHLTVKKAMDGHAAFFHIKGNTAQLRLRVSAVFLPHFFSLKNQKYIQDSFVFQTEEVGQKSCLRLLAELRVAALNKYKIKALSLYIAQVKRKLGLNLRECYNKPWLAKSRPAPQVSPEKEVAILDALRHFNVIE